MRKAEEILSNLLIIVNTNNNYANLVKETLKEIPKQFIDYMESNGVLPLDHEKKNQNKLKFETLEKMKQEEQNVQKEGGSAYFEYLENKFVKDCLNLGFDESNVSTLTKKGVMSLDINFAFEFLSTQQKASKKKKLIDKGKAETKDGEGDGETWNVPDSS